jgi:hypothetical protein
MTRKRSDELGITEKEIQPRRRKAHDAKPTQSIGNGHDKTAPADAARRISLTFWRDLTVTPTPKLWCTRGVIARREISSWIGKPGGGKSSLLTDIAVHNGAGQDWRGYRIPQRFGSVYFAFERFDLVKRRFQAHRLRDGLPDDLPIAISGQIIDLCAPACIDLMANAIKRAQDGFRCEVGIAIIDTRSKGIAAGGGDEDKARFQNIAAANLRRVIERTGVHIAGVGHTGKDPTRGERGSNAGLGDVDVEFTISGDTVRTVDITKANDQALGRLTAYELDPYEFGTDEEGQPYRTYIVGRNIPDAAAAAPSKPREAATSKAFRAAFAEAIDGGGLSIVPRAGCPAVRAVELSTVRIEFERRHATGETDPRKRADARRKAFIRALEKMAGEDGDYRTALLQDDKEWIWQLR